MSPDELAETAERFLVTLDLCEAGIVIKRESLRRDHPEATENELDSLLTAWLQHRPGAERGDAEGASLAVTPRQS